MRLLCLLLLGMLTLSAQTLIVDGGAAPMENIFKPLQATFEKASGLKLELRENGPDLALLALQKGEIQAAAAGLSVQSWFELMAEKGHKDLRAEDFDAHLIGFDKINVLLQADLAILTLDKQELKRIFTGEARNWKEFGGPDLPIVVVLGTKVTGTNKVFQAQILDKAPFRQDARQVAATTEILQAIAETPGAIGFGPVATLRHLQFTSPVTPEVGRPIVMLTRKGPNPAIKKLLEAIRAASPKA